MNILLLKGFNNYFNRIVKKYSTLADYKNNSNSFLQFTNINFNSNDGITTELVIGNEAQLEITGQNGNGQVITGPLSWEQNGTPDYLICYETSGTPSVDTIKFRWFVMEAQRTRNGQYHIALKRDVIAEHFNEIIQAPCFVEKGVINNSNDPLLFNNEQMSFNQIKQNETLLKDNTGCGWIVGYVAQNETRYPASDYYESSAPVAIYESYSSIPADIIALEALGTFQRPVARINGGWGENPGKCEMLVNWRSKSSSPKEYQLITLKNYSGVVGHNEPTTTTPDGYIYLGFGGNFQIDNNTTMAPAGIEFMQNIRYDSTLRDYYVNNILTNGVDFSDSVQQLINTWAGRYFKKDGKMYQIVYEQSATSQMGPYWNINEGTTYYTALTDILADLKTDHENDPFFKQSGADAVSCWLLNISGPSSGSRLCRLSWEYYTGKVSFVEVTADVGDKIKTYIPAERLHACDTPMDLFAIPFSDSFKVYTQVDDETGDPVESTAFTMSKQSALQAAVSLAQAGDNVYDIQILPYFPNPELVSTLNTGDLDYDGLIYKNSIILPVGPLTENTHYNFYYNDSDAKIGIMFWSRTSVFSIDINQELSLANSNPLTLKVSNDCDLYRISSPNYAGAFEFSLAKSGGRVNKFNADCTYKPYSPYIHVTPYLTGLYGENFSTIDDARGLICGGDFSITKIVNKWQEYELQNKNYQAIFDRQIQNLDVNNQIAQEQRQFGFVKNLVNMAVDAATTINPLQAPQKGVVNPLFTSLGGLAEADWMRRAQEETKDYTQDLYGYNLGNIKALPNALAKTTALTNNNKIFPFVEYFTCTEDEKDAYEAKIRYNGMTIMKISNLGNYSVSSEYDKVYVKGQLIRLEDIADDFHVVDAIYQEVSKGFFVEQ